MEVPESNRPPVPVPMAAEKTLSPGAARLGFKAPSPKRGPPEVKEVASRKVTSGTFANAIDALTGDCAARNVGVSLSSKVMTGIVGLFTSGTKTPWTLFTMPIAMAPAASALATF